MSKYHIDSPTLRKVRNRGWIPCRYRTENGTVHGWIVDKTEKHFLVWLIGDETTRIHPRRIVRGEQRYITEL